MTNWDLQKMLQCHYNLAEVYVAVDIPTADGLCTVHVKARAMGVVQGGHHGGDPRDTLTVISVRPEVEDPGVRVALAPLPPEPEHPVVCIVRDKDGNITGIGKA